VIYEETDIKGVFVIEPQMLEDERGFFTRTWCAQEFREHGLNPRLVQCNVSFNKRMGTVRGMHYQVAPYEEPKLVRCTKGSIYDVVIDLRPGSPTFKRWKAVTLAAHNYKMVYIPEGCAHGFQTLEDNSEVFYQISEFYAPEYSRGVRWDDPAFDIQWPPVHARTMSARDRGFPDFHS